MLKHSKVTFSLSTNITFYTETQFQAGRKNLKAERKKERKKDGRMKCRNVRTAVPIGTKRISTIPRRNGQRCAKEIGEKNIQSKEV